MATDRESLIAVASDPVVREFLLMADDSIVAILPYALSIAVRIGVADECHAQGGGTAETLSKSLDVEPDVLERLLRTLASCGFFSEDEHREFRVTALGELLRSDSPVSMCATLRNVDSYRAWLGAIAAGWPASAGEEPAFASEFGMSFFSHKQSDDLAAATFDSRMKERSSRLYPGLATLGQWADVSCVLDIGGGNGTVLGAILNANPHVHGILFDRPDVIRRAQGDGALDGLGERCETVAGDFFGPDALPSAADAHLLCSVLHDWEDGAATEILRRSAESLPDHGRLFICEMVLPDHGGPHPAHWSDLGMKVILGGRERTADQYRDLLSEAGMRLVTLRPIPGSFFSLIEARLVMLSSCQYPLSRPTASRPFRSARPLPGTCLPMATNWCWTWKTPGARNWSTGEPVSPTWTSSASSPPRH